MVNTPARNPARRFGAPARSNNSFGKLDEHSLSFKVGKSAEGAQYESQGQARSASSLGCDKRNQIRPERPKYHRYYALLGLHGLIPLSRGDVLRFASHLPLAFIFRAVGALGRLFAAALRMRRLTVSWPRLLCTGRRCISRASNRGRLCFACRPCSLCKRSETHSRDRPQPGPS